jgi:hypothetical protein
MLKGFFFFKVLLMSLLSFFTLSAFAAIKTESQTTKPIYFEEFKLEPRVSLWGFTGDFTRGEGQALLPLYGNQARAFFGILDGNISANDSDWLAGLGLGYRQVVKDYIVGIYAIAGCLNSLNNNTFWVANPGVEVLGQKWDFNATGYVPIIHKEIILVNGTSASDLGIFNFTKFAGHDQFDHKMEIQNGEETARGFDAEIGRVIPHFEQAKLYLGGYHFDSNHGGSTNGVEARLLWELNKYAALEAKDYYDNKNHNAFLIGIRLTLGGLNAKQKETFGISSRLMDPIEHDLVISSSGNTPVITKVQKTTDFGEILINDNIWFFVPASGSASNATMLNAVAGDGTFEHPFIDLTPDNFNAINPNIGVMNKNPLLYFAPGGYNFASFTGLNSVAGRFILPSGWGMFGRTFDYKEPSKTATFSGGLDIGPDSGFPTVLNSVIISQINVDPSFISNVMDAENAGTIVLQNSDLLGSIDVSSAAVPLGAGVLLNNSTLNFEQLAGANGENNISISLQGGPSDASFCIGIFAANSNVNFNSGINNITAIAGPASANIAAGIFADVATRVNFNEGSMSAIHVVGDLLSGSGVGILANNGSIINFANGSNKVIIDVAGMGSGSSRFGIVSMDSSASLQQNGVNLTTVSTIEDSVTFIDGGGDTGDKVEWIGISDSPLPW